MIYTNDPQAKIKRIIKYLSKNWKNYTVEQVQQQVEQKLNVGVFVNYGRTSSQSHEFEVYRKFKSEWIALLCRVNVPLVNFQKPLDF